MAARSKTWAPVANRVDTLGRRVRGHFDAAVAEVTTERAALEQSVRGLFGTVGGGVTATWQLVRDPRLRDDVVGVATSVHRAVLTTVGAAGEQVRGHLARPGRIGGTHERHVPAARPAPAPEPDGRAAGPKRRPARRSQTG